MKIGPFFGLIPASAALAVGDDGVNRDGPGLRVAGGPMTHDVDVAWRAITVSVLVSALIAIGIYPWP